MSRIPEIKSKDLQVRLLSELPESLPEVKETDRNRRSLYKQVQAEVLYQN